LEFRYSIALLFILAGNLLWGQAEFVENKGQWPDQVQFRIGLSTGALWVEQGALYYQFFDPEIVNYLHPGAEVRRESGEYNEHSYKVKFTGAQLSQPLGDKPESHYYNYYLGNDSAHWAQGCRIYKQCSYPDLYSHIDLLVYSASGALKYDFILKPGADADDIALEFDGVKAEIINDELVIKTSVNTVREKAPFAYQVIEGKIHEVKCAYRIRDGKIGFYVGKYNPEFNVVIDPEIAFSTYIGSSANNFGSTACDDTQGNLISGATVFGNNYPTTPGAYNTNFNSGNNNVFDVAISKFASDGASLLYSTYIGGNGQETPHSLIADSNDNFILMGVTGSSNFPTTTGAYQTSFAGGPTLSMSNFFTSSHPSGTDIFVAKFSAAGALSASTFIGGSSNDGLNYADGLHYNYGDAFRGEINVDGNNNIFVASVTKASDFPVTANATQNTFAGGACDGVIFKFNPSLSSLLFSSFIGGEMSDVCYALEFSSTGIITVAGGTQSNNFPHAINGQDGNINGLTDGFVIRIDPVTFDVLNGTYLGTVEYDQVYFVQFNADDEIFVMGQTEGNFNISPGLYGQSNSGQFIRKYSADLTSIVWTTAVGTGSGEVDISPTAFLVSDCNQIYFSGWGGTTNQGCQLCEASSSTTNGLPITSDAFQTTTDGSDFYLCVLAPDATSLDYASYLGGPQSHEHVDGGTSRFDKNGSVFQAVCAGCQGNSDFPTTPGAWSSTNDSPGCNIAVFRFDLGTINTIAEIDGPSIVCEGQPVGFNNLSSGSTSFLWDFGDGITSELFEPTHLYDTSGTFTITLIGFVDVTCFLPDTTTLNITILPGVNPEIEPVDPICPGDSVQLFGSGSPNIYWITNPELSATNISNPWALPASSTNYYLVDQNDCESDTAMVLVELINSITDISPTSFICIGQSVTIEAEGGGTYEWSPATGLNNAFVANPSASPVATTTYSCLITTPLGCEVTEEVIVNVANNAPGGIIYPEEILCLGDEIELSAADGSSWSWTPIETLNNPSIQNPTADPLVTTTYFVEVTNACGAGTDQVTVVVLEAHATISEGGTICPGTSLAATAGGGVYYAWSPASYAEPNDEAGTMLTPYESTTFIVRIIDENGCADTAQLHINVLPKPLVDAGPDQYFDYPGTVFLYGNSFGFDYEWSPADGLSCTDCLYPEASPQYPTYYGLTVTDNLGCRAMDSVLVKPYFPLWVPNSFTPNNDGINDYFRAYGLNIEGYYLRIFDRWGNKIFETRKIDDVWDGGIGDYYVQNDVYVWVIEYETVERTQELTGHVTVIR
jgi:gliding motility-associated-like protein